MAECGLSDVQDIRRPGQPAGLMDRADGPLDDETQYAL